MTNMTYIVLTILGVTLAAALPLIGYALLPHESLNHVNEHGRFGGLGTAEKKGRPSGNTPVANVGSLQGQTA